MKLIQYLIIFSFISFSAFSSQNSRYFDIAKIQILDKTTATSEVKEIEVGQTLEYKNLFITVKKCWQAPLENKPDSKILMKIRKKLIDQEIKPQNQENVIFYGWMIASNPSAAGIEDPSYDILAIGCTKQQEE